MLGDVILASQSHHTADQILNPGWARSASHETESGLSYKPGPLAYSVILYRVVPRVTKKEMRTSGNPRKWG